MDSEVSLDHGIIKEGTMVVFGKKTETDGEVDGLHFESADTWLGLGPENSFVYCSS